MKKIKKNINFKRALCLISGLLLLAAFNNCSDNQFSNIEDDTNPIVDPQNTPLPPPITLPDRGGPRNGEEQCFDASFTQPEPDQPQIDLIIVTDTSRSIRVERSKVAKGVTDFVEQLPSGVDLHVGVLLAHSSFEEVINGKKRASMDGRLYSRENGPKVLKSSELEISDLSAKLDEYIGQNDLPVDRSTNGGEVGLFSMSRALDGDRLPAIIEAGLFRPTASLVVLFISDENDICSYGPGIYPEGIKPVVDTDGTYHGELTEEEWAYTQYCSGITPESVYQKLLDYKGNRPVVLSSVTYTGDPNDVPKDVQNEVGYGYINLVALAAANDKGVIVDIRENIAAGLSAIGSMAAVNVNVDLQDYFLIPGDHTIIEEGSDGIVVEVEDIATDYSYDSGTRIIDIFNPGVAGDTVDIHYCFEEPEKTDF